MRHIKRAVTVGLALFAMAGWEGNVNAAYPEKEIKVVVGFPPGSVIELSGRAIMHVAEKYIKQPLVIINKPGAAQSIAMNELISSPADGYTIAVSTDGYKATTSHTQDLAFDAQKIRYVAGYARFQHVLFVKGKSTYGSFDKFVAMGRREPKKMEWAGSGVGAAPQLLGEVFFRDLKIPATYVPFKGSNQYVQAVMGGQVLSGVIDISGVAQYVKTGALDLVAVLADTRLEEFPDVPTAREKGLSKLNILNGNIVIVSHADVPPERFAFLVDAFHKAAEDPEFKAMAKKMRLNVVYTPPQSMEEQAKKTGELTLPLIKELGLYKR